MEVASNSSQILLQRKDPRVYSMAGERRSLLMTPAANPRETEPNQEYPVNGSPLLLDVDVPSSSASDVTDPSPGMLNMTPPPEVDGDKKGDQTDQNATTSPKPPDQNGMAVKKRKYVRRAVESIDVQKLRVTRNRDVGDVNEVVINNYVDTGEKRQVWPRVVPPNGLKRQPFKPPRGELEKEKDKLKINMVGPKTKTTMNAMKEMQPQRTHSVISEGFEFQANFDHYLAEDFQQPTISVDEIPDRDDQMMWIDDRVKLKDKERELDEAWTAVRRQFGGKVGLDAMLQRLMKCDYDIDKMLLTIEEELEGLPHPFEEFNEAQQAEFEKWLCYETGNPNTNTRKKNFRRMQETFLKGYYLGELVQYYYESKHRGCAHRLYHRCTCKNNLIVEFPSVQRYECYNCTKYLWSNIMPERSTRGQSYCSVCELYFSRRKKHRVVASPLTEPDEKIARAWFELEKSREKPVTKKEVFKYMESQRLETINARDVIDQLPATKGKAGKISNIELFEKTKKFTPKTDPKCWTMNKWGKQSRRMAVQSYTAAEKLAIVKAFGKYGLDFKKVADALGKYSDLEMECFYGRFVDELLLDRLITPIKKETWLGHHLVASGEGRLSNSPTPEPMGRRKRAVSNDPSYEASREVPPAKTTRRTRQTQAVEKDEHDDSASNPVPDQEAPLLS